MFIYISLNFIDEKNKNSYAWHICLYMYKNGVSSLWGIKIFKDINIVLFEFKEFSHIHCRWYLSWPYQSPLKTRTLKWTIYVSEWRIELFFLLGEWGIFIILSIRDQTRDILFTNFTFVWRFDLLCCYCEKNVLHVFCAEIAEANITL